MKTYKNLWNDFISEENITIAIHNASLGNKNPKLKKRLKYMYEHLDVYIPKFQSMVENYRNAKHKPTTIYDGISRKQRTIIVPTAYEQVVHHMIVNILKPIFMKSMYQHSYGSVPNRGAFSGKKQLEKWLPANYVLKLDIRHYFESVSQEILIQKLKLKIKDKKFLAILETIISVIDQGIPLGFYTSQWFANFYLTDLDHYISSELGFGHYMRYMDDMVILSDDKFKLYKLKQDIGTYLNKELALELKSNWQVFRFDYIIDDILHKGRPLDFMGYQFYSDKTILRKSIMIKATRKAKRIFKKCNINWYESAQILSYLGWFNPTNTYICFEVYIVPYMSVHHLRGKVSKHSKKLNNILYYI